MIKFLKKKIFLKYLISIIFYSLSKIIVFFFLRLLYKNKISRFVFFKSYEFIYTHLSYYLNLRTDLESIHNLSIIRDKVVNYKERNKHFNKRKKIIFVLNVAKNSLFGINHLKKFIKKFDVHIFELSKNKLDFENQANFFKTNYNYFKRYNVKGYNFTINSTADEISDAINELNADLLIFDVGTRFINVIDKINVKKIISINKTSLFVPHSKINLQSFTQPPWPYKIKNNKIYNFKHKNFVNVKVTDKLISYSIKNIKIKYNNRKNIILWYGNLKKLADKNFINSISKILKKKKLKFYFFGTNDIYLHKIYEYFKKNNVNNYKYFGKFNHQRRKNLISKTLLMTNTFAMHGGRYTIEAYDYNIPIINFQYNDKQWENNQVNMYYKNESIFLKKYTASSFADYEKLAEKAIDSKKFRNEMIKKQKNLLYKLTNKDKLFYDLRTLNFKF